MSLSVTEAYGERLQKKSNCRRSRSKMITGEKLLLLFNLETTMC